ncbi:uncharacterized protein GLRG_02860 [Colletotrichum graminicola M1.001]|uniref:Uncharacterized protein n=1 Tax=Colletotrichum graminicola (strain M1.001 / M2 / FGSC 10212) TaxID=645133 RepID=E3QA28_COLGM|nr:uncharacterized protein GLRG_02860 [Colletotrichum graminicola M1.001]EFQ27716.1 hypothetical protein GLRG_02860 [Colletotrichum graminicola M1.001]
MFPPLTLSLLIFFLFSRVHGVCYYPDSSIAPNDTPCQDRTAESVCCGQGYACLSNGMCQATGRELQKGGATELVRGSCTDRSWRSSSCPLFCINPETDNVTGGIGIAKCQGTVEELYYCINTVQDRVNCTAKQNVLFFQGSPTAITTIGVAATTTPASSSSSTISESVTASSTVTSHLSSSSSRTPNSSSLPLSSATSGPESIPESSPASGSSNQNVTIGAAVGAAESTATHLPIQHDAPVAPPDPYVSPPPHNSQVYEVPRKWVPPMVQDHYGPQELPGWQPEPRRG